ncbi:MAG: SDR family oxidoreductase [Anaerolineaceae bacterium]|nr:SDR family oxidoreductase [Anaerolineaceae bacterium]
MTAAPERPVDLGGRAAIVTGAGGGQGRAIALALARAGAAVALNDLNPDRAESLRAAIAASGGQALACPGDVSNRFQAANLIERARDAFGRVSLLLHAAGAGPLERPLLRLDEWDWRRLLEVNLTGAFFCTQLMARVMAEEGSGVILLLVPGNTNGDVATVAARAGLVGLARQAARELAPAGIRVHALCIAAPVDADEVANAAVALCAREQADAGWQVKVGAGPIPR